MNYVITMIPIWLVYLALTNNVQLSNLVVGLLLAAGVAYLIVPQKRPIDIRRLPGALVALVQYFAILFYDLILAGIQVARIVLTPSLPIQPGIIAIDAECETELATALSAHSITLTPGEMVVEIDDDNAIMYTHVLDATQAAKHAAAAQRRRKNLLQRIFE